VQVKAALPLLRESSGKIVLVSSGAAVSAYATWGCYGASKAVLNHLATTLAVEEPNVTTISIRPGIVDTEMQRELREIHHAAMDKADAEKFASLKSSGKLLRPDQPGNVLAKVAIGAPKELSGQFLR
jgi:NAD(P)-dependent dehydrogenase (short-subunit alcohol dehydrogenase family)